MTQLPETSNADLSGVDLFILDELRDAEPHGMNGRDLAAAVGVPGNSIGSRLRALAKRGLVRGERYAGMTDWRLTQAGIDERFR